MILLVHPPFALPSEPPPGIAQLAGGLRHAGTAVQAVDASILAYRWALAEAGRAAPFGHRLAGAVRALREPATYRNEALHGSALHAVNGALVGWAKRQGGSRLSLTDYEVPGFDPFSLRDLLRAFEHPEAQFLAPFYDRVLGPALRGLAPRIVGLSINYRQQVLPALALAGRLRAWWPRAHLTAGGGLITAWARGGQPAEKLHAVFDSLIVGDGVSALQSLAAGREPSPALVPAGRPLTTARPAPHAPEALAAAPDFAGLPLGAYLSPGPILPVASSRGCYWRRCAFCPEALHHGDGAAWLPGAALAARLAALCQRYRTRFFHLADSALTPATVQGLVRATPAGAAAPVRFYGFARVEPLLGEPTVARGLYRAGCRLLQLGIETGSARLQARIGKGVDLDLAGRVLRTLAAAGIRTVAYVLIGLPDETPADADLTRAFLRSERAALHAVHVSVLNLPVGSPLDRDPDAYGLPPGAARPDFPGELSVCRHLQTTGRWPRTEVRRYLAESLLGDPELRPLFKRMPPFLGVNHLLPRFG